MFEIQKGPGELERIEAGLYTNFLGELNYTGAELRSGWVFSMAPKAVGYDWLVAFVGEAKVEDQLVDFEDRVAGDKIYSPRMWQLLGEFYRMDLLHGVLLQRLIVVQVAEILKDLLDVDVSRGGDDLYIDGKKLSVSIATRTSGSVLIHFGFNIVEVDKWGWIKLKDVNGFSKCFFDKFIGEWKSINRAYRKVAWR